MNYLAHVFLSRHSDALMTGGLLGDFVKGPLGDRFDPAVRAGIQLHRDIDRYTDAHDAVRASVALVGPLRRRFAGIMVDVFYDHFLSRHWHRYCATPLPRFTRQVYAALIPQTQDFPERLRHLLPRMCSDDWLGSYGDPAAVDAALRGIARRFRRYPRAAVLADGAQDLKAAYAQHEQCFLTFFPDLMRFADDRRLALAGEMGGGAWRSAAGAR